MKTDRIRFLAIGFLFASSLLFIDLENEGVFFIEMEFNLIIEFLQGYHKEMEWTVIPICLFPLLSQGLLLYVIRAPQKFRQLFISILLLIPVWLLFLFIGFSFASVRGMLSCVPFFLLCLLTLRRWLDGKADQAKETTTILYKKDDQELM